MVEKIILTSDWHAEKGLKVDSLLMYLEELENYYLENSIDYIFVLGDIFDKSSSIKNEAFIPLFLKLYQMKEKGIKFLFITGNHDVYNIDNDSLVETFAPIGRVIKEKTHSSEIPEFEDKDWYFMPYTKKEEELPQVGEYLFSHLSVADFSFDNAYHATEKHAFPTKYFENFKKTWLGHFHRHQTHDNIVYIGSPIQLTRSEEGTDKGFIVLNVITDEWEFNVFNDYPKYLTITSNNLSDIGNIDFNNKLVYVKIDQRISDFVKLRYILYEKGAIEVTPLFEKEETSIEVKEEIVFDNSLDKMAIDYINAIELDETIGIDVEGLNKTALIKIFEHVVNKCS